MSNRKLTNPMQTMSQDKNFCRAYNKENSEGWYPMREEDFAEASFVYVIQAFEEICNKDAYKVWQTLKSPTKAHLRRLMAIEQIMTGEAL